MVRPAECLEFRNRAQWRAWLVENHAEETEAWLIIYKVKYRNLGLTLNAAVEEALCFGWIDSLMNTLDERRFALRFSPRKPDSVWAQSNIHRVEKLIAEGKMTAAGQRMIDAAKESGEWDAAIRREQVDRIPADLETALRQRVGGIDAYQSLTDSRKKRYIYWLQSAKRADTKQRRIQRILEEILGH